MTAPNQNLPVPVAPSSGVIVSEGETAASAVAAREKAAVEARFLVALNRPRDVETGRIRILNACKRPGFAAVAKYAKPVGGRSIVGPSIRFVEECLREWGNVYVRSSVVFDDDERRVVLVSVTDLERATVYDYEVILAKTVERRNPKSSDEIIRTRINSQGQTVSIIRATEDDFLNKQNAGISKAIRNCGLRVLPSDLVEEAMEQVDATRQGEISKDPAATRKRLTDAFYALGVMPAQIADYLGHPLESVTPAELDFLRTIHTAIKDGETTWAEVSEQGAPGGKTGGKKKGGNEGLRAAIAKEANMEGQGS